MRSAIEIDAIMLERLTIRPQRRAFIDGTTARQASHVPLRLVSITASQSSSARCFDRAANVDSGVVDEHVDRAECGDRIGHGLFDVRGLDHIRGQAEGLRAEFGRDLGRGLRSRFAITGRQGDGGTRFGQSFSDDPPQATSPAGDQSHTAIETESFEVFGHGRDHLN